MELSKLREAHNKLQEDNDVIQTQHNAEYQQLKQEKENELASLKGMELSLPVELPSKLLGVKIKYSLTVLLNVLMAM